VSDVATPAVTLREQALRVAIVSRSVHPFHGYGGLERHVYDLVRHLSARGVSVTLVTRPPFKAAIDADAAAVFDPRFVRVLWVPYYTFPLAGRRGTTVLDRSTAYLWFGYRAGRLAVRLAASGDVDLVHGLGASVLGYALHRRKSTERTAPLVFNPQGLEEFGGTGHVFGGSHLKRWAYRPLQIAVRTCAAAADRVLATDRAIEPTIRRVLGVPADRISLVPNAIDLDDVGGEADASEIASRRADIGADPAEALLLSVGRLEENKGFHILARALAGMTDRAWRWVLVGDGPFRSRLASLVETLGIRARVTLTGRVDQRALRAWYEAATLFVHPTLYEGSSLVTLEAMAHSRAVVATSAGGLPDKVTAGVTGWLVEPGRSDLLAAAIGEALADRARLGRMGAAGRAVVAREFSWPAVAGRLIDVYRELITDVP
jgi:glycogen synthase